MKYKTLFFGLLLGILSFSCERAEPLTLSPHNNVVVTQTKTNRAESVPTAWYLVRPNGNPLVSATVVNLFLRGNQFQDYYELSGYTATDDLWTVLGYDSHQNTQEKFDRIAVRISHLKPGSDTWAACSDNIYQLAENLPGVIVLDQDLE